MKSKMKRWGGIMLLAAMLAMMLGVGSVFAADEYVPVQGSDKAVKIAKSLDLKGSTSGPEHTATFNVVLTSTSPSGQVPVGTVEPVVLTFSGDDDEKEDFIDFSTVQFKLPGVYRYKVTETISPADLGIRAKPGTETIYFIDVVVVNTNPEAGHSGLEIKTYALYTSNGSTKTESLLFQNEWDNYRIKVKKNVTGNQGDKTRKFAINVNFEYFNITNSVTVRWVSGTPAVGSNPTTATKVTAANPVTVKGSSSTWSTVYLQLKDGDEVILEGMTSPMNFYISETSVEGYTTKGTFSTSQKKNVVASNDQQFIIVNDKSGTIPTGIFVNNWPYIAVILVVIAGAVFFIRRRKARYVYEADL